MSNRKVWFIAEASTAFGLPLAKYLLDNGCRVALVSGTLNTQSLRQVLGQHGCHNQDFLPIHVDLSCKTATQNAIRQTINQFLRIDFVVNNAGDETLAPTQRLSQLETDERDATNVVRDTASLPWDTTFHQRFESKVFGAFHVLKQVLPYLQRQGSGQVFNFPSPDSCSATAISTIYLATRLAIDSLMDKLIVEAASTGILVTVITPENRCNNIFGGADLAHTDLAKAVASNMRMPMEGHNKARDYMLFLPNVQPHM
jgi:NADP-dependent 3-hydroxy acid dehydrogenase YdfG